jgi:hypothetical protein
MSLARSEKNQVGLKLNGTQKPLVYADDTNLLGDKTDITKKNVKALTDHSKELGLRVNSEKTMYIFYVSSPECRAKF